MKKSIVKFNLNIVEENINRLLKECNDVKFIFPVKCCTNKKFLSVISKYDYGFDISNENEYKKIIKYSEGKLISASSPTSHELINKNNKILIFTNTLNWKKTDSIRINFNHNSYFEKSHFGISIEKLSYAQINEVKNIHFHNADKKTNETLEKLYKEIEMIVKKFPKLEILNIGGHLEDLSLDKAIEYIGKVRKITPKRIRIIVECGDLLFKKSGTLICYVVDSTIENNCQNVFLNFSQMANQRWTHPLYDRQKSEKKYKTIFYGISCCEVDKFLETTAEKIKINQKLIFDNISPYSYEWNNTFNGLDKIKFEWNYITAKNR